MITNLEYKNCTVCNDKFIINDSDSKMVTCKTCTICSGCIMFLSTGKCRMGLVPQPSGCDHYSIGFIY